MIRSQNDGDDPLNPKFLSPSVLPLVNFTYDDTTKEISFEYTGEEDIVFEGVEPKENYGTEDPRVVYREKDSTYYMMYTAVEKKGNDLIAKLA